MLIEDFIAGIAEEVRSRIFVHDTKILNKSLHIVKIRLEIKPNLRVDIYYNDEKNTISFALILNEERIFARNNMGSKGWHMHPLNRPNVHDFSKEGKKKVTISEFLDEVEGILVESKLL